MFICLFVFWNNLQFKATFTYDFSLMKVSFFRSLPFPWQKKTNCLMFYSQHKRNRWKKVLSVHRHYDNLHLHLTWSKYSFHHTHKKAVSVTVRNRISHFEFQVLPVLNVRITHDRHKESSLCNFEKNDFTFWISSLQY